MQSLLIVALFAAAPVVHQIEVHPAPVFHLLILFSPAVSGAAVDFICPPAVLRGYFSDRLIPEKISDLYKQMVRSGNIGLLEKIAQVLPLRRT